MEGRRKKINWARVGLHAFLLLASIIALVPFYIMVISSFKFPDDLAVSSYQLPKIWTLSNYRRLLSYNGGVIVRTYINSIFITFTHTIIVLILGSMAAFAFSKYRFRGRNFLFTMLLATMMVPFELSITPLYVIFANLGWLNTYKIQIIPFTANVFAMFMMRQYMSSIPDSLLEAARIDGAGHMRLYTQIMLPVSTPVLGGVSILVALSKFNDYLWPQTVITKQYLQPIMVVLPTLNEEDNVWMIPRELTLTGCTLVVIPLIIMFICLQDQFMASVTMGAVKE